MAKKIERLGAVANAVQQFGVDVVDRKSMATVVIGDDETAVSALAAGYAKALRGYGLLPGKNDKTVVHSIDWDSELTDVWASRSLKEESWARTKLTEAKDKAAGGVLVIRDINRKPYTGTADEEEAGPTAQKAGLEMIKSFMAPDDTEESTPAIVLTGTKAGIVEFFTENPDMKDFFNNSAMRAGPPAPPITTELQAPITIGRPLQLVMPARG
jgi:hypothetical protein